MQRHARLWSAGALVVVLAVGSMVAADRSSAAMATAASKFLGALTPEQRQQATFAFANSDERLHWQRRLFGAVNQVGKERVRKNGTRALKHLYMGK